MEQGYRHIRIQVAVPGLSPTAPGSAAATRRFPVNAARSLGAAAYVRTVPKLFEHLRKEVGDEVELLHDMHERVPPILAMRLAKDLEPYRLFFLEDPFSPEDVGYFAHLRQQTTTPMAMGELFNNPNEWLPLVTGRLIDFIRIHISQVGGLTMARKIAALCEFFAVRTAWHGPGDVSPVGHAANVHLDLATPQFRHSGGARVHAGRAGRVPRLSDAEGRLLLGQRQAGPGRRSGRETGGEVPDQGRSAVRHALGQPRAAMAPSSSRRVQFPTCPLAVDKLEAYPTGLL